jgi:hypothetical protein
MEHAQRSNNNNSIQFTLNNNNVFMCLTTDKGQIIIVVIKINLLFIT